MATNMIKTKKTKPLVATKVKLMSKPDQQVRTEELKESAATINTLFEMCIDNHLDLTFSPENIEAVIRLSADMSIEKMRRFVVTHLFEKVRMSGFEYMTSVIIDLKLKSQADVENAPVEVEEEVEEEEVEKEIEEEIKEKIKEELEEKLKTEINNKIK